MPITSPTIRARPARIKLDIGHETKLDAVIDTGSEITIGNSALRDKLIRKEDHVGIIDCYISRVEGGKLEVKKGKKARKFAAEKAKWPLRAAFARRR